MSSAWRAAGSLLFWAFIAVSSLVLFPVALLAWALTAPVDRRLRSILDPYRGPLKPGEQSGIPVLLGTPTARYPEGQQFGGVRLGKRYVSFYLMPVYMWPALLDGISPDLKRRMQGKSCFNFTSIDEPLLAELERLTAAGFARFEAEGFVGR